MWPLSAPTVAYRGQGRKVQKEMVQPINLVLRSLQNRSRIQAWLSEQVNRRLEGCVTGFGECVSLVLDEAEEIQSKIVNETTRSERPKSR